MNTNELNVCPLAFVPTYEWHGRLARGLGRTWAGRPCHFGNGLEPGQEAHAENRSPVQRAQGPERVEGLALAATNSSHSLKFAAMMLTGGKD
jgi:hypothetical protein